MKTNYVLIDYENVQPATLTVLDHQQFKLIVFIGATQSKITFEVAAALQSMGSRAEYIKIAGNGSNALDFHIAFYLGQLIAQEPDAYFHIISKDTGFDPLINYLKNRQVRACRWHDVTAIPVMKATQATSRREKIALIVANLQQQGPSKPRTVKTLANTINTLFQKKLSEADLSLLVHDLQTQGIILVNDTNVSYALPA